MAGVEGSHGGNCTRTTIKKCGAGEENISKMKREPTLWENIFANDILDKGLISKIYKELT